MLLNWRRPYNLAPIVKSLAKHEFIGEIIIWDNSGMLAETPPARIIRSPQNIGVLGRFWAARDALYGTIYTQDDDYTVSGIPALYERFGTHRGRITAGLSGGHFKAEANRRPWLQLGWGSFFLREWVSVLDQWILKYGEDDLLQRKADRIFSILFGRHDPMRGRFTRLRGPDGTVSDRDANSLWHRGDHSVLTKRAAQLALELKHEVGV